MDIFRKYYLNAKLIYKNMFIYKMLNFVFKYIDKLFIYLFIFYIKLKLKLKLC